MPEPPAAAAGTVVSLRGDIQVAGYPLRSVLFSLTGRPSRCSQRVGKLLTRKANDFDYRWLRPCNIAGNPIRSPVLVRQFQMYNYSECVVATLIYGLRLHGTDVCHAGLFVNRFYFPAEVVEGVNHLLRS